MQVDACMRPPSVQNLHPALSPGMMYIIHNLVVTNKMLIIEM